MTMDLESSRRTGILLATVLLAVPISILKTATADGPGATEDSNASPRRQGPVSKVVFADDFEKKPGPEWSHRKTETTPKNWRTFLGQFGNDEVRLALKKLPRHKYVRVSFDLFIIRTWDGGGAKPGDEADVWSLRVRDGPSLLRASFAEYPTHRQTFPDAHPGPQHPRRTGATATGMLGYTFEETRAHDAVYRLRFAFPHTAGDLALIFAGSGLQELTDESWGLDNVKVEVLSGPQRLSNEELQQRWKAMHAKDPVKAFKAYVAMMATAGQAAEFMAERAGRSVADEARVRRLVVQLGDEKWKRRQEAQEQLEAMGIGAAPALREVLKEEIGPEVEGRVEGLLATFGSALNLARINSRYLRIVRLLEADGSPKTWAALRRLSRRGMTQQVQGLADAALRRLARKALAARVAALVVPLGSETPEERESARQELVRIGVRAISALRAASADKNVERARAARRALEEIDKRTWGKPAAVLRCRAIAPIGPALVGTAPRVIVEVENVLLRKTFWQCPSQQSLRIRASGPGMRETADWTKPKFTMQAVRDARQALPRPQLLFREMGLPPVLEGFLLSPGGRARLIFQLPWKLTRPGEYRVECQAAGYPNDFRGAVTCPPVVLKVISEDELKPPAGLIREARAKGK